MRKTLCATALVTIALLGAGCKKSDPLVGKWSGSLPGQAAASGASATYEFKADKSVSISAQKAPTTMTMTGDYTTEGENLTINIKDVQVSGLPKGMESYVEPLKKALTAKPMKSTFKVGSDDQIALTGTGPDGQKSSQTLTRVKEGS